MVMKRFARAGFVAAVLLAGPSITTAGTPNIYHSITVTMASAYFVSQDDCLSTEVWISATDGQWASQGGGVTTGGDLAVSVRVVDTCAVAGSAIGPMAGGGGEGVLLYDGFGRIAVPLGWSPRIASAWTEGSVELTDQLAGGTSRAWVSVTWSGGPLTHETTPNNHGQCAAGECLPWMRDFEVLVNTHDNNLHRDATATIELTIDGAPVAFDPSSAAVIEQVKSACMEIPTGTFSGDTDYCF
jgi:hypothetical protein